MRTYHLCYSCSRGEHHNFRITNYDVHMELGRDEDKTSTLRTTLTITADFPPNQNRGIAPIFVKTYGKHSTSFNLESVTDDQGTALEYHWEGDELRIGNTDVYVSGLKTYVITYTQRNVTKYYADTNKDPSFIGMRLAWSGAYQLSRQVFCFR